MGERIPFNGAGFGGANREHVQRAADATYMLLNCPYGNVHLYFLAEPLARKVLLAW